MICIQKIYGFHGINRQNIEKKVDMSRLSRRTDERTDGRKVENRAVFCWTRNRKYFGSFEQQEGRGEKTRTTRKSQYCSLKVDLGLRTYIAGAE